MIDNNPVYIMLIGVPASGKSTFIENYLDDFMIYSSDYHLQEYADSLNSTYDQIFSDWIGQATEEATSWRNHAFKHDLDVVDDHTNLTPKVRAKRLSAIPAHYTKIGLVFSIPESNEHVRRLNSRIGKSIPDYVIAGMIDSFKYPEYGEGFDIICSIT
jgi:predicted kinase